MVLCYTYLSLISLTLTSSLLVFRGIVVVLFFDAASSTPGEVLRFNSRFFFVFIDYFVTVLVLICPHSVGRLLEVAGPRGSTLSAVYGNCPNPPSPFLRVGSFHIGLTVICRGSETSFCY